MKGILLLLFVICAFSAAMVPRHRRALPSEEQTTSSTSETTSPGPVICAPNTPCKWTVYNAHRDTIEYNLTNIYCVCDPSTVCRVYEHDPAITTYVHRCQKKLDDEETTYS